MRKHTDAIAVIAIGFALLATSAMGGAVSRRIAHDRIRLQPLILEGRDVDGGVPAPGRPPRPLAPPEVDLEREIETLVDNVVRETVRELCRRPLSR